ncbi:MAG TPA: DAK2 domain-containing protein [Bryobacteraceae bacterium]|nr:DAK2 domain-containing protein [Bryobacteraceae bacterium]
MSRSTIDGPGLRDALSSAAERFKREEHRLNALDGATGDGDHGITMRIGFEAIRASLSTLDRRELAPNAVLRRAGKAFMGATGGAIGVVFGKALISGGKSLEQTMQIGPAEFIAILKGMEAEVASVGRVKPGDKTILDPIHMAAGVIPMADLKETVRAAYLSAEQTAAEMARWPCKVGRASRLGERAIGNPDPGAVSFSIFLAALLEWLEKEPVNERGADLGVKLGATTYVFRYLLQEASKAPAPSELIVMARNAGLDCLQVCENARPLNLSCREWVALKNQADALDLEITLGCMTLDAAIVTGYLDRVEAIGGSVLRIALERQGCSDISLGDVRIFLDRILPELQSRGLRLAIENHFYVPSRVLAEAVSDYPENTIGFCLDVANSLRKFEDLETVFSLLGNRAFCYHVKDYRLDGSDVGFSITGAPFGEGEIDRAKLWQKIFEREHNPHIYLEIWTPSTGNWECDVSMDAKWLATSIDNLRRDLAQFVAIHSSVPGRTALQ